MAPLTIAALRRYAVARTFPAPQTLAAALDALGFVQADPIRAPARAQDLILRQRVDGYRAGDLERHYPSLAIDEDFFVNYGFLAHRVHALMHPRAGFGAWPAPGKRVGESVLAFVRERGPVHPREVDAHFAHGAVTNYWGGSSSATTHVLDHLHYRGHLRVARRDAGIRVYAARDPWPDLESAAERRVRQDALVDLAVGLYAPVPSGTLSWLVRRLRYAAPQWRAAVPVVLARSKRRLASARVEGVTYYWPPAEDPTAAPDPPDTVRLLAPFDPLTWDRARFEHFWGWPYRFEAYTPAPKRQFGYYALPILWRDAVVGWANATVRDGRLVIDRGFAAGRAPRDRGFARALAAERDAMRTFLGLG
ncbi:MAG: crosslink repair DNA glycosylase YcaQ family protein [Vicinamibacterales bacterium]